MSAIRYFLLAGAVLVTGFFVASTAVGQPSPQPQECVCSVGVNIGTDAQPRTLRHCQCGILSCAVLVEAGQLQCTR